MLVIYMIWIILDRERKRSIFYAEIQKVIEDLGNKITLYDTIDLQLA